MSNATMNASNGTARKSLASQIDRLDTILDGLADGLNDAVTMLVRESVQAAVREAVQGVVVEFLSNPGILVKLQGMLGAQPAKTTSTKPSWIRRGCGAVGECWEPYVAAWGMSAVPFTGYPTWCGATAG